MTGWNGRQENADGPEMIFEAMVWIIVVTAGGAWLFAMAEVVSVALFGHALFGGAI